MQAVRCVETGKVFKSIKEAAAFYGLTPGQIHSALYSNTKGGGYTWKKVSRNAVKRASIREQAHEVVAIIQEQKIPEKAMNPMLDSTESQALYRLTVERIEELEKLLTHHQQALDEVTHTLEVFRATREKLSKQID